MKNHESTLNTMYSEGVFPTVKPTLSSTSMRRERVNKNNNKEYQKFWEVSEHCSKLLFPLSYPELTFSTRCANFYYLRYCARAVPDGELVTQVRNSCYRVLSNLNRSELQVKNFILPVQLLKLKYIDPYSRQRIIEGICQYLSCQTQLQSVVLEQAAVTFADLCRFLLSVGRNSVVRRVYLWDVLDKCSVPFRGSLQSEVVLDDIPRIPYTYNPGGRKYLRKLEKEKKKKNKGTVTQSTKENLAVSSKISTMTKASSTAWIEALLNDCLKELTESQHSDVVTLEGLFDGLLEVSDQRYFVYSQMDVGVQCDMSEDKTCEEIIHIPKRSHPKSSANRASTNLEDLALRTKSKADCCQEYLKVYENSEISIETLREIYLVALNGLINLTTLSINYHLLADGTGAALLAIGSVARGRLRELELLCELEDRPVENHQQNDRDALHAIPDVTWITVKTLCPELKVFMVCSFMSTNDVTKMFVTRSIPLCGVHFDNGFCPTLVSTQIMFFKTLRFLPWCYQETLQHIDIVLWHSCGRIDSSLVICIVGCKHLRYFAYHGPLQFKASVGKLCDAALRSPYMISFKLMLQGDPCYSGRAKEIMDAQYVKYLPRFIEKSILLTLGTHCS